MESLSVANAVVLMPAPGSSEIFSNVSRILVSEVLHLREAIDFYKLHFDGMERNGQSEAPSQLGCGAPGCCNEQLHFDFSEEKSLESAC